MRFQAPKGTRDLLPDDLVPWRRVEEEARALFERYGFHEVRTPIFEDADLFARGIGRGTDIVEKEMYSFQKGDSTYVLRPELTASIVRLYVERSLDKTRRLRKFSYLGPLFRHERQQAHRWRQFWQVGVETIGAKGPLADAETIALAADLFKVLGIGGLDLRLNTIGCAEPACRPAYREEIRRLLEPRLDGMCGDCRRRFERNPFRILDCKEAACREEIGRLPPVTERVCDQCRAHFAAVRSALDGVGVVYRVDPTAVRGLDYYARTVYEFACPALGGSQNALGGGGRYDGLLPLLSGPDVGGVGFALGIDRMVEAMAAVGGVTGPAVFVVAVDEASRGEAFKIAQEIRAQGVAAEVDLEGRSAKAQMKEADRSGVRWAAFVDQEGSVRLRDMRGGAERVVARGDLAPALIGANG